MKYEHDRGAFNHLVFQRCVRGFTLSAQDMARDAKPTFAFDRIEDLAAWLVEQYAAKGIEEAVEEKKDAG